MLKVTIKGAVYSFDNDRYPLSEAIALEEKLGIPFYTWRASLDAGSAKALAGFVWLVLKRNGQDVAWEDIISGAYDVASSDVDIEQEGGEDPTEAPLTEGDGSTSGIFAERFGIRPWEWKYLTVTELDQLIRYLEMTGGHRGG